MRIEKFIDCYIETETCNLKCHYCYIAQQNKFKNHIIEFSHTPAEIREALSVKRLGGPCLLNLCAGGRNSAGRKCTSSGKGVSGRRPLYYDCNKWDN